MSCLLLFFFLRCFLCFLFFYLGNASICRPIANPSQLRDVEWATQTCVLGFSTVGVWPETIDGSDLNTCARSRSGGMMATGDDFGKIKLYAHPACQPKVRTFFFCFLKKEEEASVTTLGEILPHWRILGLSGEFSMLSMLLCFFASCDVFLSSPGQLRVRGKLRTQVSFHLTLHLGNGKLISARED